MVETPLSRNHETPFIATVAGPLRAFFALEAASGILLLASTMAALAWVNLGGLDSYRSLFTGEVALGPHGLAVRASLREFVNGGLMTIFFLVVAMEVKGEMATGELRTPARAALPAIAALGGMFVPAVVFFLFNPDPPARAGFGIPTATDIAFSIGVLSLVKRRVPPSLMVFVLALAIFDDVGGILVVALFYGQGLKVFGLALAALLTAALVLASRANVRGASLYAALLVGLWIALYQAGVHPALAGVPVGLALPARGRDAPLSRLLRFLHPWVAFAIMPAFALANVGVDLRELSPGQLVGRVAVGTAIALAAGKLVGIFSFTAISVWARIAPLPRGASWTKLLGVSLVCGIGFTVALFIAALAYLNRPALLAEAKVGILAGSVLSGLGGAALLTLTPLAPRDG